MKSFISEFLDLRKFSDSFWSQSYARLIVTPPVASKVSIVKSSDTITIREAYSVGRWYLSEPIVCFDDIEMKFRVTEAGDWIPLYVKEGNSKPRFAFRMDEGAFSPKPIVAKRQLLFAERWADRLTAKGLHQGAVDVHE